MNYYNEIKEKLIDNEINKRVKNYSINRSDLDTYYNVGKLLSEAGSHYGEGVIREYSIKLTSELGRGYSTRNLWLMLRFYELEEKVQTLSAQLSWSHYVELLPYEDINKIRYYIKMIEVYSLSVRQLREKVKSNEYERLPENAKKKFISEEKLNIIDFVKNPIFIKNNSNSEIITEKVLQELILEDITGFMKELGYGFSFIDSEYPIKLGNKYNYIDLLLFNIEYNCYVVVELKVTELKKEHIGQIEIYMNYIDNNLKKISQDKTIGIIICRENNGYVIKYCSDKRIIARNYELT